MKQSIIETAKKILAVNRKTLKTVHDVFGVDFEENSSVKMQEIKLPTTLKSIIKNNNIDDTTLNILLIQDKSYNGKPATEFRTILFDCDAKFKIDGFSTSWRGGLNNYFRKSDFEENRKNKDLSCFLITVNKEEVNFTMTVLCEYNKYSFIQEKKAELIKKYFKELNMRAKYNKNDIRTTYYSREHSCSVSRIMNAKLDNNNLFIDIDVERYGYIPETREEHDVIDKSGYNVYVKRWSLKNKARQLKASRDLNKLQNMDFSKENAEIKTRINNTKARLIEVLQESNFNTDNYKTAVANLEKLNNVFENYIKHLNKITNAYNNNENGSYYYNYRKPEDVLREIEYLNKDLDKLAM